MGGKNWGVLLAVTGIGLSAPAAAADWSGSWAARTTDRTYEIVSIAPAKEAADGWRVTIRRPTGSWLEAGGMVSRLGGRTESVGYGTRLLAPDTLETTDAPEGARGTQYRLSKLADGRLHLTIVGAGVELLLEQVRPGEAVSSQWPEEEVMLVQRWPDNLEMTRLYDQDQADRKPKPGQSIDWAVVRPADTARRKRTEGLIADGALHSGADFYHAAFVLQHGEGTSDFLKAHVLAIAAAAQGYGAASWIAAATLDRYLTTRGEPQIFGTQYHLPPDAPATQEPYNRALLTDGLRAVAGVPSLAAQERRREAFDARRRKDQAAAGSTAH
jgi:hypothetical protein